MLRGGWFVRAVRDLRAEGVHRSDGVAGTTEQAKNLGFRETGPICLMRIDSVLYIPSLQLKQTEWRNLET